MSSQMLPCYVGIYQTLFLISSPPSFYSFFFFFNDPAPTEFSPFPLHDPLPIPPDAVGGTRRGRRRAQPDFSAQAVPPHPQVHLHLRLFPAAAPRRGPRTRHGRARRGGPRTLSLYAGTPAPAGAAGGTHHAPQRDRQPAGRRRGGHQPGRRRTDHPRSLPPGP